MRRRERAPVAGAADLRRTAARLRVARGALEKRSVRSIASSIEATVEEWLRPDSVWRRTAEQALPSATGLSLEMIRFALPTMIEPLRPPALSELLANELGGAEALDSGAVRAPSLVAHVLSGNIPGLAAVSVALTLSVKAAALIKPASGDRVFPQLWIDSIGAVDPVLGACAAACYWPGGDRAAEDVVLDAADVVVAFGDDDTIADLESRCAARFIGHGHKVSFAVVTRRALSDAADVQGLAAALALDVTLWDQRGCLSPQICLVEGGYDEALLLGEHLASELESLARRLPGGPTTLGERAAVQLFRLHAKEWKLLGAPRSSVLAPAESIEWTVVVESEPRFEPTPLHRSLRIVPLPNLEQLGALLAPARRLLECAGLACAAPQRAGIEALLRRAGVHRVCALGEMQRPPLSWRQGERPRVAEWMTWNQ